MARVKFCGYLNPMLDAPNPPSTVLQRIGGGLIGVA